MMCLAVWAYNPDQVPKVRLIGLLDFQRHLFPSSEIESFWDPNSERDTLSSHMTNGHKHGLVEVTERSDPGPITRRRGQ